MLFSLPRHVAFADEAYYIMLAKNLVEGKGYTYYAGLPELHFPPLFPLVLAVLHAVVPSWEIVTRVAYVLFGTILPLPIYLLGRDMYGFRIGMLAGLLAAVMPAFTSSILFDESLCEPLYLVCLFSGIHQVFRAWQRARCVHYGVAGCFFSLAYLTRPEGFLYVLVALAFMSCVEWRRRHTPVSVRLGRLAGLLGAFLAIASPYLVYLRLNTGEWALTTKSTTSYTTTRGLVYHDRVTFLHDTDGLDANGEMRFFAQHRNESLAGLLLGPYRVRVLPDIATNLRTAYHLLIKPYFFGRYLAILAILGFVGTPWTRKRFAREAFNIAITITLCPVFLYFISDRLLYGILLPLTLWAACGIDRVFIWIEQSEFPWRLGSEYARWGMKAIFCVALFGVLSRAGYTYFFHKSGERAHVWPTVEWVKNNLPPEAVLMSNSAEVALHSGRGWIPLPVASTRDVIDFGLKRKATHLCLQACFSDGRPDQKRELFTEARDFEGMSLVIKVDDAAACAHFAIYRLNPGPRSAQDL